VFRSHVGAPIEDLIIEIRPKCGKCKKEFMLNLKNYLPGKLHACTACGNFIRFDETIADNIQRLIKELEVTIQKAIEDIQKLQ
jgi:hypothetical protein